MALDAETLAGDTVKVCSAGGCGQSAQRFAEALQAGMGAAEAVAPSKMPHGRGRA